MPGTTSSSGARTKNAFRTIVLGDRQAALAELEAVQEFAEDNLVALNRDADSAALVLDACLYLARAYLDTGELESAERQAQDCVRGPKTCARKSRS